MTGPRTEQEVLALVEQARGDAELTPRLLALLDERHEVYAGVDTATVVRIRGALLRALSHRALSDDALPFVLSELESAFDPWLTAVAAHALRRRPEPSAAFVAPLLEGARYIRQRDDWVRLECHGGYGEVGPATTATLEILRTLGWLGASGQAALDRLRQLARELPDEDTQRGVREAIAAIEATPGEAPDASEPAMVRLCAPLPAELAATRLEDHDGAQLSLGAFCAGSPTLLVFFFTRCGNPAKCPATIARLGRLQARIAARGADLKTAALTYDPAYDTPRRLAQFARSWGATPGERHRFFRTVRDLAPLRSFFELGVSYGGSTVNQHQLEAFLLDRSGTLVRAIRRRRWDEDEILGAAAELG